MALTRGFNRTIFVTSDGERPTISALLRRYRGCYGVTDTTTELQANAI